MISSVIESRSNEKIFCFLSISIEWRGRDFCSLTLLLVLLLLLRFYIMKLAGLCPHNHRHPSIVTSRVPAVSSCFVFVRIIASDWRLRKTNLSRIISQICRFFYGLDGWHKLTDDWIVWMSFGAASNFRSPEDKQISIPVIE